MDKKPENIPIREIPNREIWCITELGVYASNIKPHPSDLGSDKDYNLFYYSRSLDQWVPAVLSEEEYDKKIKFATKATIISKRKHYAKKNKKK